MNRNWIVFLTMGTRELVFRFRYLDRKKAEHCAAVYRSWGWTVTMVLSKPTGGHWQKQPAEVESKRKEVKA